MNEYPFAQLTFTTDGVHLFHTLVEFDEGQLAEEQLIATDAGGQLVWGPAVADRINQFDYVDGLALRWQPSGSE